MLLFLVGPPLFAYKKTGLRNENDFGDVNVFEGDFYDKSKFELVDTAGVMSLIALCSLLQNVFTLEMSTLEPI